MVWCAGVLLRRSRPKGKATPLVLATGSAATEVVAHPQERAMPKPHPPQAT